MSTVREANSPTPASLQPHFHTPLWKCWALGSLLLLEGLVFTIRFDTATLEQVDAGWATFLSQASLVGRFAISVVTALVVFGGRTVAESWREVEDRLSVSRLSYGALSLHVLSVATFFFTTREILEGWTISTFVVWPWLAACAASGLLALASWSAVLLPLDFLLAAAFGNRKVLLIGSGVAAAAVAIGQLAHIVWPHVAGPTFASAEAILRLIYSDVVVRREDFLISANSFSVIIAPACSGLEGIGLIAIFLGAFLWSFRQRLRFPRAFVLLPLGMAAIWIANILRIVLLTVIGASFSPSVAAGGFHSQAGWLAFNAVALGAIYVACNSSLLLNDSFREPVNGGGYEYAAGPYLLPLLALLAVMMVTAALSPGGFDWLYPCRVVAALSVMAIYFPAYRARGLVTWSWSWAPLIVGAAVFALWMALEPLSGATQDTSAAQNDALSSASRGTATFWIVLRVIGSVITVPLVEELAFRGYLTRQLISEDFESVPLGASSWFSWVASSTVFGVLHGRWLAGTVAGLLFCIALYRRRQFMDAVIAHATANALVTCYVLWSGNLAEWS